MHSSYKTLCNKIFTSGGYTFVQNNNFHILGKNISIINDNFINFLTLCLYENDIPYYINIPYPQATIWANAISVYNNNEKKVVYSDFIQKKNGMIINNSDDINNLTNIIKLYKLLHPNNTPLNIVRYNEKIYLTKGVF
jgi:hypothetical protein